jgi:hypothetical protein
VRNVKQFLHIASQHRVALKALLALTLMAAIAIAGSAPDAFFP